MSQRINILLLLILDTCLQVNAKGQWHAQFSVDGLRASHATLYFVRQGAAFPLTCATRSAPDIPDTPITPSDTYPEDEIVEALDDMLAHARALLAAAPQEAAA